MKSLSLSRFIPYNGFATLSNLKIVPIVTEAEKGFHLPEIGEIEKKITGRTRAIMICSPNNPTGTVLTEDEIRKDMKGVILAVEKKGKLAITWASIRNE